AGQVEGNITYGSNSKFVVERYIPGHRAWRLLTAPVANTLQTINQAWQEGTVNADLIYANNLNPTPGYGTHITGTNRAADPTYGFDPGPQNNTSIKYYNNGWKSLPSGTGTNNSLINSQPAFLLFVRGDRSVDLINHVYNPIPIPAVLRVSGQLNTGTQTVINIAPNTFKLIGNPYASSIDMRKINKTGFSEFYLWDANLGSVGAYQTFSLNVDGDYEATPGQGYPGSINNFIQSGQGFFVKTPTISPGTVTINESAKEFSGTSSMFEPITLTPVAQLRTNIYAVNSADTTLMDGVLINFDNNASNTVNEFDAIKLPNFSSSIGMSKEDKILVIERRKPINSADTVFYYVSQSGQKDYQLEFIAKNLTKPWLRAFIEDKFLNTKIEADLNGITRINFSTTTGASSATDRFRLVFKHYEPPAPKTTITISALKQDQEISVEWEVLNESNIKQYNVERSAGDHLFVTLTTATAKHNNSDTINYQWTDITPVSGVNYYRIKTVSLNGGIQYSNTVKVTMPYDKAGITIFPNPVVNGVINLRLINQPEGNYFVRLIGKAGQVLLTRQIKHKEGSGTEQIKLNKALGSGNYLLEVSGKDNTKTTLNVYK
ncbi:MAG: T9SS type A sorting domain-containing protein, partial [Chitinophagaceae bacterium]|nr:T9SS type A sorting domain-containing protein [Chitinophagaceae bacterium]